MSSVRVRLSRAVGAPLRTFRQLPITRRVAFHVNRIRAGLDFHFFRTLVIALVVIVVASAFLVTVLEPDKRDLDGLVGSGYWSVTTVIGSGDSSYVKSPGGYVIGWLLAFFGVAIVATLTAAIVGFVIDFLLKEGQGMGASGYSDHVVVCGWNATARELVAELQSDEFSGRVVVLHESERSPAGSDVYFVRGDATSAADLERAGIPDAAAAIICPSDATNEADMRSILTVLAIETMAPQVRTVVEVNNPKHVEHLRRAHADEILVTSRLASRLLARTALYPGLASLVTDIVSGGEGSELYRVELPDEYAELGLEDLSSRLRSEHNATLLAVSRDGHTLVNPPSDFRLARGDTAVVVAESLGELHPLEPADALDRAD